MVLIKGVEVPLIALVGGIITMFVTAAIIFKTQKKKLDSMKTSKRIGLVLGPSFGAGLAVMLGLFFWKKRKGKKSASVVTSSSSAPEGSVTSKKRKKSNTMPFAIREDTPPAPETV